MNPQTSLSFFNPSTSLLPSGASVSFADRTALADDLEPEEISFETPTMYLDDAPVPGDRVREWSERNRTWRGRLHPNGKEAAVFVAGRRAKEEVRETEGILKLLSGVVPNC